MGKVRKSACHHFCLFANLSSLSLSRTSAVFSRLLLVTKSTVCLNKKSTAQAKAAISWWLCILWDNEWVLLKYATFTVVVYWSWGGNFRKIMPTIKLLSSQKRIIRSSVERFFLLHQISISSALYRTTFKESPLMTTESFEIGLMNSTLPKYRTSSGVKLKNCQIVGRQLA